MEKTSNKCLNIYLTIFFALISISNVYSQDNSNQDKSKKLNYNFYLSSNFHSIHNPKDRFQVVTGEGFKFKTKPGISIGLDINTELNKNIIIGAMPNFEWTNQDIDWYFNQIILSEDHFWYVQRLAVPLYLGYKINNSITAKLGCDVSI